MRILTWAVSNGLFALAIYFGFVEGIVGARNVAVFFAWCGFVISLFAATDGGKAVLRQKGPPISVAVNAVFDFAILAVFLWFGWFVTGAAWLIHSLILAGAYSATKDEQAKEAA